MGRRCRYRSPFERDDGSAFKGGRILAKDVLEAWFEGLATLVETLGQFILSLLTLAWIILAALVEVLSDEEDGNDL
jgi:hypothetical protein